MLKLDKEKLSSLFEDFHTLTSIHICLFDEGKNEIFRYPETFSGFCAYTRQNAAVADKCKACDNYAFEKCTRSGERYTYTCHMNLTETATPLSFDGELIGYIMMGQVKSARSDFDNIPDESLSLIPDTAAAKRLYDEIPAVPDKVIKAAAHILDACASYLYVSKLVSIQSEELKKRIDEYISVNIRGEISVDDLCGEFRASRTEIYGLFKRFYGASVAQYVRTRRLSYAKKLLTDTALPVSKIADKTGFTDYNYFSKTFKKYCGISASGYRKRQG